MYIDWKSSSTSIQCGKMKMLPILILITSPFVDIQIFIEEKYKISKRFIGKKTTWWVLFWNIWFTAKVKEAKRLNRRVLLVRYFITLVIVSISKEHVIALWLYSVWCHHAIAGLLQRKHCLSTKRSLDGSYIIFLL